MILADDFCSKHATSPIYTGVKKCIFCEMSLTESIFSWNLYSAEGQKFCLRWCQDLPVSCLPGPCGEVGGHLCCLKGLGRAIWYQVSGLDCHHLFTLALVETPLLLLASGLWPTEPSDVRYKTVLVVNKTG